MFLLVAFVALCTLTVQRARLAEAVMASPFPFTVQQADGAEITLFVRGSEYFNYLESVEGYPVTFEKALVGVGDDTVTTYSYATMGPNGQLQPTMHLVGAVDPTTIPELSLNFAPALNDQFLESDDKETTAFTGGITGLGLYRRRNSEHHHTVSREVINGPVNNFVLMIRWSDCPFEESSAANNFVGLPSVSQLDALFNGLDNSLRDVYLDNSYGKLVITSILSGWITVSMSEVEAAAKDRGLSGGKLQAAIMSALTAAQANGVDFAQFDKDDDGNIDMLTVLHSGYAAEWGGANYLDRIWSHKWALPTPWISGPTSIGPVAVTAYHISPAMWGTTGTRIGRIGVISHETGHFLGLPDLYDVDDIGKPVPGAGLGSYSLMANSWGFDGTQNFPPLIDAWCKITLGWMQPTPITQAGTYSINAAATTPQAYIITQGFPDGEYLLIENRQPLGYDQKMPLGGLAIYHVDEKTASFWTQGWPGQAGWPQNGNHYRVALLQADGLYQLESTSARGDRGDLYSNAGASRFLNATSVPNTNAYQAGIIFDSGVNIVVDSAPGNVMTFTVTLGAPVQKTSTCSDKIRNGDETGVDCGGSCAPCRSTCQAANVACTVAPRTLRLSTAMCLPGTNCTVTACCRDTCSVAADNTACNDGKTTTTDDRCFGKVCRGSVACTAATGFTCATNQIRLTTTRCHVGFNCNTARCCAMPMRVASIAISQPKTRTIFQGVATVRIVDKAGKAVPGARVSGIFRRLTNTKTENRNGLTATSGTTLGSITLRTTATWTTYDRTVQFCVTGVTKTGFIYQAALNKVTCVTVPATAAGRRRATDSQQ